jgi:hypothetical protein
MNPVSEVHIPTFQKGFRVFGVYGMFWMCGVDGGCGLCFM